MSGVTPKYTVQTLDQVTAEHVTHALVIYGWNLTRTAEALAVPRRTLQRLIDRHKLERPSLQELIDAENGPEHDAICLSCGHTWFYDPAAAACPKGCGGVGTVDPEKREKRRGVSHAT